MARRRPVDGNDPDAIEQAIAEGVNENGRPSLVVVKTVIGYGSPNKAGTASAHGEPLGEAEVAGAREALGWDYGPFVVPDDVSEFMGTARKRGESMEVSWQDSLREYESEYPEMAAALRRDLAGEFPDGWDRDLDELIGTYDEPVATRAVSGKSLAAITAHVPSLVGGSADLAPSNNSTVAGRGDFSPENPSGRTLHFGVREHAMGAVANGIALHRGFIPFAATFLIFSDYMRASIRLGALSHCRVIWVFTHDSVGVGEDGPTHEPISQLMGLRMIPNLTVLRPADADETIEAWRTAMNHRHGPVALILSRQALPQLPSVGATVQARDNFARGAYIARDSESTPDLIIMGTGSEFSTLSPARRCWSKMGWPFESFQCRHGSCLNRRRTLIGSPSFLLQFGPELRSKPAPGLDGSDTRASTGQSSAWTDMARRRPARPT